MPLASASPRKGESHGGDPGTLCRYRCRQEDRCRLPDPWGAIEDALHRNPYIRNNGQRAGGTACLAEGKRLHPRSDGEHRDVLEADLQHPGSQHDGRAREPKASAECSGAENRCEGLPVAGRASPPRFDSRKFHSSPTHPRAPGSDPSAPPAGRRRDLRTRPHSVRRSWRMPT